MTDNNFIWWKHGVIYQIYPRSYMDTNGDGIGDLPGILSRLDYLQWLGVDAIWISPCFKSPMDDFGYDVSDYRDIDPMFGTIADLDNLLAAAHERNIKVILDFVPNHSSHEHAWFKESRSSRDNPKHDWYTWRDAKPDGSPPNNWVAVFGGPAWEWDETRQQYYLHMFLKEQPDLNWRNPAVKAEMLDTLRFWLARGVDGFRVDVAHFCMKDPDLRDNPVNEGGTTFFKDKGAWDSLDHVHDSGHPDIHQLFREMRQVFDEFEHISPRYSIGEIHLEDAEEWGTYFGDGDELTMPFNFKLLSADWNAAAIRGVVDEMESVVPDHGWPNAVLANHDEPRIVGRYGKENARLAAMLLLTLRGTPTMYYGDELGMPDTHIPADKQQDPWGLRVPGLNLGRDPERTPMQWDSGQYAGFSEVEPWLPVGADLETYNVTTQQADSESTLNFYRNLLSLRKSEVALHAGDYQPLDGTPDNTYVYIRQAGDEKVLVALNFASTACEVALPASGTVLVSSHAESKLAGTTLALAPNAGCIIKL